MENLNKQIQELQKIIDTYGNIVFFGGAGVSTESGIPDFRSVDGLYHQQYDYPPETILSHTFYRSHTEEFFRFYRNKMLFPNAQPNAAHKKLAELEAAGKVRAVITHNIDGLHQAAGSRTVLELHGSVLRNYCEKCYQFYGIDTILNSTGIPRCEKCGGIIKPDVVLYEEGLDEKTLNAAVRYIHEADVLIIGGTSVQSHRRPVLSGRHALPETVPLSLPALAVQPDRCGVSQYGTAHGSLPSHRHRFRFCLFSPACPDRRRRRPVYGPPRPADAPPQAVCEPGRHGIKKRPRKRSFLMGKTGVSVPAGNISPYSRIFFLFLWKSGNIRSIMGVISMK